MVFTVLMFTTRTLIVVTFIKKHWSTLVGKGFVGKSLGLGKNGYVNSGIIFAWFLAPNIKHCLVIDDYEIILAKRTFKGYSEENRMIKWDDCIYRYQKEKLYQVDFCLIGLKYSKESKYPIENKVV